MIFRRYSWPTRWGLRLVLLAVLAGSLPATFLLPMRWINPPTTAFMKHNLDKMHADGYPNATLRSQWVDYDDISASMRMAAVASEDQNFPRHHGFDVEAIRLAWEDRQSGRDFRGASTITQQAVKNLFLWRQQSWLRKGVEAWLTTWVEILWPKRRILEVYLNIVQFDANVFGVESAAQKFFKVSAAELTPEQSALLAVALPAPSIYQIKAPGQYMLERQQWVLAQSKQLGRNHLRRVDRQEDAMSGITWLVLLMVIGFVVGLGWHTWKALKSSDAMLKHIDKSKLRDLDKDQWND